jgi:hypothetical protein
MSEVTRQNEEDVLLLEVPGIKKTKGWGGGGVESTPLPEDY